MKIKGKTIDKDNNIIAFSDVKVLSDKFECLFDTKSNEKGEYEVDVDEKSEFIISVKDYGVKMLETWISKPYLKDDEEDLDLKFDTLEIYGLNVILIKGAPYPLMIYFRPMSLERCLAKEKEIDPIFNENFASVKLNGTDVEIINTLKVDEVVEVKDGDKSSLKAYLLQCKLNGNLKNINKIEVEIRDKFNNFAKAVEYFTK